MQVSVIITGLGHQGRAGEGTEKLYNKIRGDLTHNTSHFIISYDIVPHQITVGS
jgi:hypothetical protein